MARAVWQDGMKVLVIRSSGAAESTAVARARCLCYLPTMEQNSTIPAFGLYGETSQLPDVIHVEAFSARAPTHDWHIAAHRHTHMSQLFVLADGQMETRADAVTHKLFSDQFLYVPEHCVHELSFEPQTEGLVFSFPVHVVRSIGPAPEDVLNSLSKPFCGAMTDTLKALAGMLEESSHRPSTYRRQTAVALTHAILATLAELRRLQRADEKGATADRLQDLDALIGTQMNKGWSASNYADALSVSTGHLSRLCRQSTGLGLAAYIEQKVMAEACRLLAFTRLPVSDIGYRLGYSDPSYFTKRFNKSQGQAPSAYRRSIGS